MSLWSNDKSLGHAGITGVAQNTQLDGRGGIMKQTMLFVTGIILVLMMADVIFADESRFVFSNNTVTDRLTGLMWMRVANMGGYTWSDAFKVVSDLNRQQYATYDDWRLPTLNELDTLVKYANGVSTTFFFHPYILLNKLGFYEVQESCYWSSNTDKDSSDRAYSKGMHNGKKYWWKRSDAYYVWPVRAGR